MSMDIDLEYDYSDVDKILNEHDYRKRDKLIFEEWERERVIHGHTAGCYSGKDFDDMPKTKPAHGDTWGRFTFNRECLSLVHSFYGYDIDLERCTNPAMLLDYIFQISSKGWMTTEDRGHLLEALEDLLNPQATLCSFGANKVLKPVAAYLEKHTTHEVWVRGGIVRVAKVSKR